MARLGRGYPVRPFIPRAWTTLLNDGEGTSGSAVSAGGPAAFSTVVATGAGTTVNYDSTQAGSGSTSILQSLPTVAATAYCEWTSTATRGATANAYVRLYVYMTARPTVNVRLATLLGAGSVRGSVVLLTTGAVRIQNAAGSSLASTTALIPLNQWTRVEFSITNIAGTAGDVAAAIFSGANLGTTTPDTGGTVSSAAAVVNGTVDGVRFGASASVTMTSAWNLWQDDLAYSNAAMPAPIVGSTTPVTVTPPAGVATSAATAPAVTTTVSVAAPSAPTTAAATAAAVSAAVTVNPPGAAATAASATPGCTTGVAVNPPAGAKTDAATAPAVSVAVSVTPPAGVSTADATAPAVATLVSITAPSGIASASATAPVITLSASVTVSPPAAAATSSVTAPALTGAVSIVVTSADAAAASTVPNVSAAVAIAVPAGDAIASATAPTIATQPARDITVTVGPTVTRYTVGPAVDCWRTGPSARPRTATGPTSS